MDIFKEMKKEHDEFRKMAEKIGDTTTRATKIRTEGFAEFKLELTAHHEAEEIVLVPVLKEKKATKEMGIEIVEEHDILSRLLDELEELPIDDEKWIVKFKVLKEIMEKHLEEEENEISEKAHEEFDQKRLDEMGEQFKEEDEKQEEMLKEEKKSPKPEKEVKNENEVMGKSVMNEMPDLSNLKEKKKKK